jgi:hypothetical protein
MSEAEKMDAQPVSHTRPEKPMDLSLGDAARQIEAQRAEQGEAFEQQVKVKLDGVETSFPAKELAKGYMRQADYTKKTQELAESRKLLEQEQVEIATVRAKERERLELLDALLGDDGSQLLEALGYSPDQRHAWQAHRNKLQQESMRERMEVWQGQLRQEAQKLKEVMPELTDANARQQLAGYLRQYGYSGEELSQLVDHRVLVVAEKARRYDELMSRKQDVLKPQAKAAPMQKPQGKPGAPSAKAEARKRAMESLRKSGSLRDAARLIEARYQ